MYNEKSFKNHIFWMKVKRLFLILVFSIAGALAGVLASDVLINISVIDAMYRTPIIIASTFMLLSVALLLTASTGKEIQDAYWKMALLRKVIIISKKLDNVSVVANEELDEMIDTIVDIEGQPNISNVMPNIDANTISNTEPNVMPNTDSNVATNIDPNVISNIDPNILSNIDPDVISNVDPNILSNIDPDLLANIYPNVMKDPNVMPNTELNNNSNTDENTTIK